MTTNIPTISVIIPIYNSESFLDKCIKSIINQSFNSFEIILVNDGSTDSSGVICDNIEKTSNKIKVIHQENRGVTKAREIGVNSANGNFICFVDSDDILMEDALLNLYSKIEATNSDLIIGSYRDTSNRSFIYENKDVPVLDYLTSISGYKIHTSPWAKLYRKTFFDNYVFDLPRYITNGEDLIMDIRYVLSNLDSIKIAFTSDIVYSYNIRNESVYHSHLRTVEYEMAFIHFYEDSFYRYKEYIKLQNIIFTFRKAQLYGFIYKVPNLTSDLKNRRWIRLQAFSLIGYLPFKSQLFCFFSSYKFTYNLIKRIILNKS